MMDRDCERWISIADAAVLGEPMSAAEREFEQEHRAVCPRCRGEASIWSSLRPSRLQAVPRAEDVHEIVSLAAREPSRGDPSARALPMSSRAIGMTASAALVAAVASVIFWLGPKAAKLEPSPTPLTALAVAPASTPADQGPPSPAATEAQGAAPALTAGSYAEDSCAELAMGVTLCVAAGSQIEPGAIRPHRVVHLVRGRALASLDSQPATASLTIATKGGKVTAVGAIFSVELGPHGESLARVHQGKVVVRAASSITEASLVEGQAVELGAEKVEPMSARDRARDARLLAILNAKKP